MACRMLILLVAGLFAAVTARELPPAALRTYTVTLEEAAVVKADVDAIESSANEAPVAEIRPSRTRSEAARSRKTDLEEEEESVMSPVAAAVKISQNYAVTNFNNNLLTTTESVIELLDRLRKLPPAEAGGQLEALESVTSATEAAGGELEAETESVLQFLNDWREQVKIEKVATTEETTTKETTTEETTTEETEVVTNTEVVLEDTTMKVEETSTTTVETTSENEHGVLTDAVTPKTDLDLTTHDSEVEYEKTTVTSVSVKDDTEIAPTNITDQQDLFEYTTSATAAAVDSRTQGDTEIEDIVVTPETTTTSTTEDISKEAFEESPATISETSASTEPSPPSSSEPSFTGVPLLVVGGSTARTTISEDKEEEEEETPAFWDSRVEVAVLSASAVLLCLVVAAACITYCVCRNLFNKKNIYTTMEAEPPKFFTKPGPPIILRHEVGGFGSGGGGEGGDGGGTDHLAINVEEREKVTEL
jgi:hypothetical protein